jgi:3-oxoacyl-(acyl-carrier-protein) synthase
MNDREQNVAITASSSVTEADLREARLGPRFGRLDLSSRLALLAVEQLKIDFDSLDRDRIGLCVAARHGSLSTDVEYWKGRDAPGGFSPTLFAYTLPSAPLGEIAIRHRLRGPNLCFIGVGGDFLFAEATEMIGRGAADSCLCVTYDTLSAHAAALIQAAKTEARASAKFVQRSGLGQPGQFTSGQSAQS